MNTYSLTIGHVCYYDIEITASSIEEAKAKAIEWDFEFSSMDDEKVNSANGCAVVQVIEEEGKPDRLIMLQEPKVLEQK